ncbi:MAG: biliverdin-producing heme oxygenase [Chitinophagales bacterium]|nr:biliverdin-producing heme oxygenase [Chitinophagales bacterium]
MMIMGLLKEGTKLQHDKTEQMLFAGKIMDGSLTLDDYRYMLLCNYLFNAALEKELVQRPEEFDGFQLERRLKTALLESDLAELGINNVPVDELFSGWSFPQLLGACYVAEGSTLGGKVIERALQKNENIAGSVKAFNYFNCYGDETGPLWKAFGDYASQKSAGVEQEVVAGANKAFDMFQSIAVTAKQYMPVATA